MKIYLLCSFKKKFAFYWQKHLLGQDSVSLTILANIFYNVEVLKIEAVQKTVIIVNTFLRHIDR